MNEENMDTGVADVDTDLSTENQAGKSFTQEEIDKIVKERLDRERKRFQKQFEGIDVEKYRVMMEKEEQLRIDQDKAKGNFEKVLHETVSKKDSTIQQLQKELQAIKVDGSLLNAASSKKAINPQQVVRLLKDQITLGADGNVEVLDDNGNIRYSDGGSSMTVDELVSEFLQLHPHFVGAGPSGSGSQGNIANKSGQQMGNIDISTLDMNSTEDRMVYKKFMKSKGINI